MAVDIFIARHGQNQDNAKGTLNGHRDLPLTELGRRQARELGKGIKDKGLIFDAIYTSPLSRAIETAEIVREIIGVKPAPIVLPELIERDFGVMTGKPISQIPALCAPDIITTETIVYFLDPEGAETFPQLLKRGHKLLSTVRSMQSSGKALLVGHGDFGKMIYAAATGKDWRRVLTDFHFGNGELIEISPNDKAHVIELEQYNP
jgi:broad specificity phosphatase PhoE